MTAASTVPVSEPAGGDQSHADGEQGDCRCDHALDGGAGMGEPGPVAVPVVGVADHFGVGADEPAVDRDRVIGCGRLVLAVERIRVGDDAFDQRRAGDRGAVGVMIGHALEDALDLDALAGLEDTAVPIGGIFEIGHPAVAGDQLVLEVQVLGSVPCALLGVGVGGAGVGDGEHDARVALHGQRVLDLVAVAGRPAGGLVPFLDLQARGHVGRMRLDLVGWTFGAVEGFVEPVGDVFAGLDALALDERGPCLLAFVVAADEVEHALGRGNGDHALVILRKGEQFAAIHTGVEAAAGDLHALAGDHPALLGQVAHGVHGPLAGVLVMLGVERVGDAPVGDLLVGAVRG